MNFKLKRIAILCAGAVLFGGCTSSMVNADFTSQVNTKLNKVNYRDSFKKNEINIKDEYIDLSVALKLSSALKELSKLDGNVYYLKSYDKDFLLNPVEQKSSKTLFINSFARLKNYIENTTNYTLKISKNRFRKDIKVVDVLEKNAIKNDLANIPFMIKGKQSVSDALQTIAKISDFSVIYTSDFDSQNSTGTDSRIKKIFDSAKIFYKGNNVAKFLDYVSNMFDVYVDIDYSNKVIKISKYKTKIFNLIIPNYEITVKNSSDSGSSAAGGAATAKSENNTVTDNINIGTVGKFMDTLKSLISADRNSKILNNQSGMVAVKTTKQNMQTIEKMFASYNNFYSKQIDISVNLYEFILSKNYNFGVDLSFNDSHGNFVSKYITNTIFSYSKGNFGVTVNSDNDFIRFSKRYKYRTNFTNNIPESINFTNNKDYLKSITATTTTGTATTTSSSSEIGTLVSGEVVTILPRIYGNKVFVKSEVKINTINSIETQTVGNDTITLPDLSVKTIPSTNVLKFGERKIIGVYETHEDTNTYKGVMPLEYFIIGGEDGKKYVRKLIVLVIGVNKK